ncbi:MAG: C45 family autoproteolytic acyltransferase/hydrolase [Candidatus Brocadiia bacterium]
MSRMVLLSGSPGELGRAYGELAGEALRQRLGRMRAQAARSPWSREELLERGRTFAGFVARTAPEWLDEAAGVAEAARVERADLLALNALPRGFWESGPGGCTSAVVAGSASATHDTLLHKNRDEHDEPQDFHVRRSAGRQVLASRDVGRLGFAHFHSDRALAGANNTGSEIPADELRECGLACVHLLRLVAERASTCDEAVAVLEQAVAKEVAGASGGSRGMIFLLADPRRGAVVEMTSRHFAVQEVRDAAVVRTNHFLLPQMQPYAAKPPGQNTLRRYDRAHQLLDPVPKKNLADFARLARDHAHGPDSICNDNAEHFWMTVSACTHLVREHTADPLAHSRVAMGNPRNTLFVPIPRAIEGLPAACVSGRMSELARRLYAAHGVDTHLAEVQAEHERAMAREFAAVGARARFGAPERLREELTGFVARAVERVRGLIESRLGSGA